MTLSQRVSGLPRPINQDHCAGKLHGSSHLRRCRRRVLAQLAANGSQRVQLLLRARQPPALVVVEGGTRTTGGAL